MREIRLDASNWNKFEDFYGDLLPALGAPAGHGVGINPLIDPIIGGNMNSVEPPLVIKICGTAGIDSTILDHLILARDSLALTRAETAVAPIWGRDVEATIEISGMVIDETGRCTAQNQRLAR